MDELTPVTLLDSSAVRYGGNDLIWHEAEQKMVIFYYDESWNPCAAVLKDDNTLGTPAIMVNPVDYNSAIYDPYSEKILVGKSTGSNITVLTVSGDTVSAASYAVSDDGLSGTLGDAWVILDGGTLVISQYGTNVGGPFFYVFSINQSTGALTQVGSRTANPMGLTDVYQYSQAMAKISSTKFLYLCDADQGGGDEDQVAMVMTVSGGAVSNGAINTIGPLNGQGYRPVAFTLADGRIAVLYRHLNVNDSVFQILSISGTSVSVEQSTVLVDTTSGLNEPLYMELAQEPQSGTLCINAMYYIAGEQVMYLYDPDDISDGYDPYYLTAGENIYVDYGNGVAYDPNNDRFIVPVSVSDGGSLYDLILHGVGGIKPLFWTNFIGQTEIK